MWHASVSTPGEDGYPMPVSDWSWMHRRQAKRRVLAALSGVGAGPTMWDKAGNITWQARRWLSDAELAMLDPAKLPSTWDKDPEPRW